MDDMREVIDDSYGKREAAVQLTATYTKEEQVDDFLNRMEEVFPGSSVEERLAYAMFAVKQVKTMTAIASKMEPGK
jgi:DNA-binding phage protein